MERMYRPGCLVARYHMLSEELKIIVRYDVLLFLT